MDVDSKVIDDKSIIVESSDLKEDHEPTTIDQNICNNLALSRTYNDSTDHEDRSVYDGDRQKDNNQESINSHTTSMSSITISSGSRPSESTAVNYGNDFPIQFSQQKLVEEHTRHTLSKVTEESVTGVETSEDNTLRKTLSFRTDSTGSLGSLMSNVDIPASDTERSGTGSNTPDSSNNSTPIKKSLHNVSNTSLLVSALKHNHRLKKKSVSFSLPSPDDIARRVRRKNSLIFQELADFDDNIPDYQVSPKNTNREMSRKPRSFSHVETESGKRSHTYEAQSISGITVGGTVSKKASFSGSPMKGKPPVGPNGSPVVKRKTPPPLSPGSSSSTPSINSSSNVSGEDQVHIPTSLPSFLHSIVVANSARGVEEEAVPSPTPQPTLMQRVATATAPLDLCTVFDVSTESIFTGGELMLFNFLSLCSTVLKSAAVLSAAAMLCRRGDEEALQQGPARQGPLRVDRAAHQKHTLVRHRCGFPPMSKDCSLYVVFICCRAKNAKDRLDNHKVKFFLLDKNSPYVNTSTMLSTATSCKEEGQSGSVSTTAGPSPAQSSTPSPTSPIPPSIFTQLARGERSMEARASLVASDEEDDGSRVSPVDTAQPASRPGDGSLLGSPSREATSGDGTPRCLPARADGEMVGIIHSAVISHLTIRIKTESGDYLSLTVCTLEYIYMVILIYASPLIYFVLCYGIDQLERKLRAARKGLVQRD